MRRRRTSIEGNRLKSQAHALLENRRHVYVNRGRRAMLKTMLTLGGATIDDVRAAVELPDGIDPTCFGSVPGPLARAGIIRRVGFASTTRPLGHARPVTVWQLADRSAAKRWLSTHPDKDDPASDEAGLGLD